MKLASLVSMMPLALLAACSTVAASGPGADSQSHAAPGRSAGDVAGTVAPSQDAAAIARLRAEGPAALTRLLAQYDRTAAEPTRRALAATIDRVAAQRYATASRLFWYTDLAAAKAAARASGKPILSLRMLGRLDEDLSCANSRFFRTTLYPNAAVSQLLRDRFILHWSSERLVPKVTVDFGDGRTLASTVTGNSAHFVLDADGRPLDVLPGLYAAPVFVRELETARALHAALRGQDVTHRTQTLITYHRAAADRAATAWRQVGAVPVLAGGRALLTPQAVAGALAAAQRATVSKAFVEVPLLKTVDVGADPGALPGDIELWASIGQRLLGLGDPVAPAPSPTILDPAARGLIDSMLAAPTPGVEPLAAPARVAVLDRLEQTIVADTALNEVRLRPLIRSYFLFRLGSAPELGFAELDAWIYDTVFHTPADDAWLGLLPRDTFTGLPGGAIVSGRT